MPDWLSAVLTNWSAVGLGAAPVAGAVAPVDPVRLLSSDERSGLVAVPLVLPPVRLASSDDRSGLVEPVVEPVVPPPVSALASPSSDESMFGLPVVPPIAPLAAELLAPPGSPRPPAACVVMASLSSDAKSAPVEPPALELLAVPVAGAPASCCSIDWIRAWTAAMPSRAIRD